MWAAHEYVKQQFKDPWYSEVLYATSKSIAGSHVAIADYEKRGAVMILVTAIFPNFTDTAAVVVFADNFRREIFRFVDNTNSNQCQCATLILKAHTLRITADFVGAEFSFSVQHQYLREWDYKEKAAAIKT